LHYGHTSMIPTTSGKLLWLCKENDPKILHSHNY
jgi:hypothetical protein